MEHVNEHECEFRFGDHGPKYLLRGPRLEWGIIRFQPGQELGAHKHGEVEETFYFEEGTPLMVVNGEEYRVVAGDVFRLEPEESLALDCRCPVCGKGLVLGVLHRAVELADRPKGGKPAAALPGEYIIPLREILAEIYDCGSKTKKVMLAYHRQLDRLITPDAELGAHGQSVGEGGGWPAIEAQVTNVLKGNASADATIRDLQRDDARRRAAAGRRAAAITEFIDQFNLDANAHERAIDRAETGGAVAEARTHFEQFLNERRAAFQHLRETLALEGLEI